MLTNIELIRQLRDETGAGVMDCRKALEQSFQNLQEARELLLQAAAQRVAKRADNEALHGRVEVYSHTEGRIAVMVEIHTETDFASRSEVFRRFAREIALQITSECPLYVKDEEIPQFILDELVSTTVVKARSAGKPENILQRMVAGALEKYKERHVLLRQTYLRDENLRIHQVLDQVAGQIGEKVIIKRFQRWEINPDLAA